MADWETDWDTDVSQPRPWEEYADEITRVVLAIVVGIGQRWQIYRDDDEANTLLHHAVDLVVRDAQALDAA